MEAYEVKPSLSQAKRLKELKQNGKLTDDMIDRVLSKVKKPPKNEPSGSSRFRKYLPDDFSQKQINDVIIKLLKDWKAGCAT
jgi:ParB family chromosome partitioning protein